MYAYHSWETRRYIKFWSDTPKTRDDLDDIACVLRDIGCELWFWLVYWVGTCIRLL
jgi:hypothetical protein